MKKLELAMNAINDLNILFQNTTLAEDKQNLLDCFKALLEKLIPKFHSEMDQEKKLPHFFAICGLTRIHHQFINEKLSRNNSHLSYMRSFVHYNVSDRYERALDNILSRFYEVFENNFERVFANYFVPRREHGSVALGLSDNMGHENSEASCSLSQLEKRLTVITMIDLTIEHIDRFSRAATQYSIAGNAIVYLFFGAFASLLTGGATMVFRGNQSRLVTAVRKLIENISFEESLIGWRAEIKNILTSPVGTSEAMKLFTRDMDQPNQDILGELSKQNITLEEAENIWPSDKYLSMYCPISKEFFVDPVTLGVTGHTFNRNAIEDALKQKPNVDPYTNLQISVTTLKPNHAVRDMIIDQIKQYNRNEERVAISPKL